MDLWRMEHLTEFRWSQPIDAPEGTDEIGRGTECTGGSDLLYTVGGFQQELFGV